MSETSHTTPAWFRGGVKLYRTLLEITEERPDMTELAVSPTIPSESEADMMLEFLSDELMNVGFTGDWEVTARGQEIEDLIDVFNDIAQPD
ncbi:hypothetical protein [Streptomyces sp. ISL-94]|uniref:hypothetical protein n=1 Tax=Streptomyces sp. ISL-94 TaxID=2819190 RepID=UPI001BE4EA22|nr:hypothetical protein [Streptomyces sp. ISL-94]MBT2481898.1 hypothetical protein [Streptomyces sp. ISL-94]